MSSTSVWTVLDDNATTKSPSLRLGQREPIDPPCTHPNDGDTNQFITKLFYIDLIWSGNSGYVLRCWNFCLCLLVKAAKPLTSEMLVRFYSSCITQQHPSNAYFALFLATLFHFHSWLAIMEVCGVLVVDNGVPIVKNQSVPPQFSALKTRSYPIKEAD
jgi:hypothetical protein